MNKVNTKAVLRWDLDRSLSVLPLERELLRRALASYLNREGTVIITDETTRSQDQNRTNAIEKLTRLVNQALKPRKRRVRTRPTAGSRERRLKSKGQRSRLKKQRSQRDFS